MRGRKRTLQSVAEQARIASLATREIVPPDNVPLSKEDIPFFANVIAEFARSEWTAHQLELAALLARSMADMAREQILLREEGAVVTGSMGTPIVNPRRAALQMHANTIVAFRRSLALHARAKEGEARDVAKRRRIALGIEEAARGELDDLIAKPN